MKTKLKLRNDLEKHLDLRITLITSQNLFTNTEADGFPKLDVETKRK